MTFNFKNKTGNARDTARYMLAKTIPMFEWQGLPDTIPYRELEKMLQVSGYAFLTKVEGELYIFNGGLGGEPDVYGNPTKITIANPALKFNATLDIEKDGVLISNDDMKMGLMHLFNQFAFMDVENNINLILHGYSTRMQRLISASDDKTRESAELYVKRAIDGEIAIVGENALFEGVKVHGGSSQQSGAVKPLIEYSQYLTASLYNEIGLSSNTNLKRERLVSAEVEQSEDSVFPLVLSMLKCRTSVIDKINEMFDLELRVDFGSVWKVKHVELVDDIVTDEDISPTGDGIGAEATDTAPETTETETETKQTQEEQTDEENLAPITESGIEQLYNDVSNPDLTEQEQTEMIEENNLFDDLDPETVIVEGDNDDEDEKDDEDE